MHNDLISRSVAIDEFYKRVGGDFTIEDIKYIEKVLEEVPATGHVDIIIGKMADIIQKYHAIGTPEECREAVEVARSHSNDGWIYCGDGKNLPEKEGLVLAQVNGKYGNIGFEDALQLAEYCRKDGWIVEGYPEWESPDVVAWHPLPETYRLQKSVGEDYRQHVMERFLKTE